MTVKVLRELQYKDIGKQTSAERIGGKFAAEVAPSLNTISVDPGIWRDSTHVLLGLLKICFSVTQ